MSTQFKIITTVDITETRARKGDDKKKYDQQQNFLTLCNTIALRVNPTINQSPKIIKYQKFEGHKVWELYFDIEYEAALDIETLLGDFNLVPFIGNLDESVKFQDCVFRTSGEDCNIIFEQVDK